jgi:RNA polymerase sigma factor (sigma-70 family)
MNLTFGRLTRLVADSSLESDGKLLAAYLNGSQPAFRQLVDRHGPLVFGVCLRILRHQQDAEAAFQAVFLILARRAGDLWPQDAVGSWLYGVACRVALKARTLRSRNRGREQPLEDVAEVHEPRFEPDVAEVVARAVCKLPGVYRAAVVACDLQGLSRKDAARQLNWSEGTLSSRLARAKRLLANRLLKTGVALPAAGLATAFGTIPPVQAGLSEAVMLVTTATVGVPIRVVALTQGVVTNVFAFKLKLVVAATLTMCTIGFGAYCAGAGDEPGSRPKPDKASPSVAKAPDQLNTNTTRKQVEGTSNTKPNERVITLPEGSASVLAAKLAQMTAEMKKNPVEIVDPIRPANSDVFRLQGFQLKRASAQIVATRLQTFLDSRFPSLRQSRSLFRVTYDTGSSIVWVQASPTDLLAIDALITEWDTIDSQAINDVTEKPKKPVEIEVRRNKLVITSDDKEALDPLVSLAQHLTSPRPDENLFKVIRLKNVLAEDAAKSITEIFNGPQQNQPHQGGGGPLVPLGGLKGGTPAAPTAARIRVVAEKSSNSIVVIKASPIDLLTIENLLKDYVDRDSTKRSVPADEKPKQPKTFELRLQYIKRSDGNQTEVGFYIDSNHPEFDGRGISRGKPTADDVEILIDGKKGRITDLLPGDTVTVQLSPDKKSVTRIELSLKTRLNVLEKEADALRQRIQSLEKGK